MSFGPPRESVFCGFRERGHRHLRVIWRRVAEHLILDCAGETVQLYAMDPCAGPHWAKPLISAKDAETLSGIGRVRGFGARLACAM